MHATPSSKRTSCNERLFDRGMELNWNAERHMFMGKRAFMSGPRIQTDWKAARDDFRGSSDQEFPPQASTRFHLLRCASGQKGWLIQDVLLRC